MQQHLFLSLFLSLLCFAILRVLDVKMTSTTDRENIFTACCQAQVHFNSLRQQMWNFAHSSTVRTGSMLAASWLHARIPVLPKREAWKPWTQMWGWEERAPVGVHSSSQPVSCSSSMNCFSPGIRFLLPLCWWIKPACTPTASRMFPFTGLCKTEGKNPMDCSRIPDLYCGCHLLLIPHAATTGIIRFVWKNSLTLILLHGFDFDNWLLLTLFVSFHSLFFGDFFHQ